MKTQMIFSATLAVALFTLVRAGAVSADPAANAPLTAAATNATPADTMTALFGDPVVAKGTGFAIKRSELDELMAGVRASAAAHGQTVSSQQANLLGRQILDRLIRIQLLLGIATDADKAKGKETTDKQMAALLKQFGSQEGLDRQLKASGMTIADLRSRITQEATAEAALERALNVSPTEDEAKKFYADHPAYFEMPEAAHVRHILLMTMNPLTRSPLPADQKDAKRKQIEDLLKRARAGEDFAKLATEYSEDPGSKDKGGEIDPFSRGRGEMVPEFEAAAFSLTNNQVSDVVTTMYGYHIIKLLDKTPPKTMDYPTAAEKIKDTLIKQQMEKVAPAYLEKLTKDANVEIMDPDLKALDMPVMNTNAPAATDGN